ncbi:hypothetical protein [Mycobacterium leprae]|nr:hypothetical protein [Mycobacterium leprae]
MLLRLVSLSQIGDRLRTGFEHATVTAVPVVVLDVRGLNLGGS